MGGDEKIEYRNRGKKKKTSGKKADLFYHNTASKPWEKNSAFEVIKRLLTEKGKGRGENSREH